MEKKIFDLSIDPEFEGLIPSLQGTELSMLTENILENGCEMPLMVWNGTIVDGHNRYRICQQHGIPFAVEEKDFDSRDAAKVWIIKNQLVRRNLSDFARIELVLPLEDLLKEDARKRQGWKNSSFHLLSNLTEGEKRKTTRGILAELAGVSEGTFFKAVKLIESGDEKTIDDLRKGKVTIHGAYSAMKAKEKQGAEEKPAVQALTHDKAPQSSPSQPAALKSESESRQPERPKFESLLDKPIFDRNQRTQIDGPIIFQPVVSEESMAAFKAAKQKDTVDQSAVDGCVASTSADVMDDTPSDNEGEVEATNIVEQDMQELIDDFLDGLSSVLDGVDSAGAKRILEMVRYVGEQAVHTVETYMKKMED